MFDQVRFWLSSRRGGALAVAMAAVVAVVSVAYLSRCASEDADLRVSRTHEVIATLEEMDASLMVAETSQRDFVLTGLPEYAERSRAQFPDIVQRLDVLEQLVSSDADQVARVAELREAVQKRLKQIDGVVSLRIMAGFPAAQAVTFNA